MHRVRFEFVLDRVDLGLRGHAAGGLVVMNLVGAVVALGYLRSLLDNAAVVRFLSQAEPAMLGEFQKIMDLADMKATG